MAVNTPVASTLAIMIFHTNTKWGLGLQEEIYQLYVQSQGYEIIENAKMCSQNKLITTGVN